MDERLTEGRNPFPLSGSMLRVLILTHELVLIFRRSTSAEAYECVVGKNDSAGRRTRW